MVSITMPLGHTLQVQYVLKIMMHTVRVWNILPVLHTNYLTTGCIQYIWRLYIATDIWSRIHRSEKSMSSKSSTLTVVRADCEVAWEFVCVCVQQMKLMRTDWYQSYSSNWIPHYMITISNVCPIVQGRFLKNLTTSCVQYYHHV